MVIIYYIPLLENHNFGFLFKLYINDLPDIFDQTCFPITLDKISINCLMFADDLLLLSETPEGLQNCIDKLNSYCNRWQLSINIQKTKVIPKLCFSNKRI
jgi:hypothetical protein